MYDRLTPIVGGAANPSFLINSVLYGNQDGALATNGPQQLVDSSQPLNITGNVFYVSYDTDTVTILTQDNTIANNVALGMIKASQACFHAWERCARAVCSLLGLPESVQPCVQRPIGSSCLQTMGGVSGFDNRLPAVFKVMTPRNNITGNVAAGSERLGWLLMGPPCSWVNAGRDAPYMFLNNAAHASLAGMRLLASNESMAEGCTGLANFTSSMSWDFDLITVRPRPS